MEAAETVIPAPSRLTGRTDASGVLERLFGRIQDRCEGRSAEIQTGFNSLDWIIGGLVPGELTVVGGFAGTGTTAFMIGIIRNLIARNLPPSEVTPVLVSLTDEIPEKWMLQMLSIDSGLGAMQILRGADTETLEEARRRISGYPIVFSPRRPQDVWSLASQMDQMKGDAEGRSRPRILFVDRLEDHYPFNAYESSTMKLKERIAQAVAELRGLAEASGWAVIAGTRLRHRQNEDLMGAPTLRNFRNPTVIADAADKVILLHRPELFVTVEEAKNMNMSNLMKISVLRNVSGPAGECVMRFERAKGRFEEWIEKDD